MNIDPNLVLKPNFHIALDNRLVKPGDYFAAIKGEVFDGHQFIDSAKENGAVGILEENDIYELAKFKLNHVNPKIVGVTGSSGKTTTTNLICQILGSKYSVCLGNLNTKLGLATNILNDMPLDCQVFVAEIGMDKMGEIAETVKFLPLDVAVITTINETHAEKLGSVENIAKAKFEIVLGLKKDGMAVLNKENEWSFKQGSALKDTNIVWFDSNTFDFSNLSIPGEHNKLNTAAACCVAQALDMSTKEIEKIIPEFTLPKGRLNFLQGVNGSVLIDDSYNASPASTTAALKVLADTKGTRKIAMLGNMLELGTYEKEGHKRIAKVLSDLNIDVLVAVGELGKIIYDNATVASKFYLDKSADFEGLLASGDLEIKEGDVVLVKGSQGARMEKISAVLLKDKSQVSKVLVRQDKRWV